MVFEGGTKLFRGIEGGHVRRHLFDGRTFVVSKGPNQNATHFLILFG